MTQVIHSTHASLTTGPNATEHHHQQQQQPQNDNDDDDGACQSSATSLPCVERRLWQIVAPVIIFIGLLGNLVVIIIFSRLRFTQSSTLTHMFALAVADSVVLSLGPMRYWIMNTFDYDVRVISNAGCKLHLFLLYTFLDFSAWILVSVTVERVVCVWKPLHVRGVFTVRRTVLRLFIIFVLLCCLNGHYFFSNGLISDSEPNLSSLSPAGVDVLGSGANCTACNGTGSNANYSLTLGGREGLVEYSCDSLTQKWEDFEEYQFVYIDLCFDSFIPFLFMATGNAFIIVSLRRSSRSRYMPRSTTRRQWQRSQAPSARSALPDGRGNGNAATFHPTFSSGELDEGAEVASSNRELSQLPPPEQHLINVPHNLTSQLSGSHSSPGLCDEGSDSMDSANPEQEASWKFSTWNGRGLRFDLSGNPRDQERRLSRSRPPSAASAKSLQHAGSAHLAANRRLSQNRQRISSRRSATSSQTLTTAEGPAPDEHARDSSMGVTRTLIIVTSVFLMTTLPSSICLIVDSYVRDKEVSGTRRNLILDLSITVTALLQYSNYGANFLLYTARSRRFRQEFQHLLGLASHRFRSFRSSVLSGGGTTRRHRSSNSLASTSLPPLQEDDPAPTNVHGQDVTSVSEHAHSAASNGDVPPRQANGWKGRNRSSRALYYNRASETVTISHTVSEEAFGTTGEDETDTVRGISRDVVAEWVCTSIEVPASIREEGSETGARNEGYESSPENGRSEYATERTSTAKDAPVSEQENATAGRVNEGYESSPENGTSGNVTERTSTAKDAPVSEQENATAGRVNEGYQSRQGKVGSAQLNADVSITMESFNQGSECYTEDGGSLETDGRDDLRTARAEGVND